MMINSPLRAAQYIHPCLKIHTFSVQLFILCTKCTHNITQNQPQLNRQVYMRVINVGLMESAETPEKQLKLWKKH